jgi:carbamoyltransferase
MRVLGISCYYHDAAAALVEDNQIIFAVQEERLSRIKHDSAFPTLAISKALEAGKCDLKDVDVIAFYENPELKLQRLWSQMLGDWPHSFSLFSQEIPHFLQHKFEIQQHIRKHLSYKGKIIIGEHHRSHAASAFYTSNFERALILTLDGVGEWDTTAVYLGEGNTLTKIKSIHFPHSLGLLYSVFTSFLGFEVNEGEYKVMGLAPYGTPRFVSKIIGPILKLNKDGSYSLNQRFFRFSNKQCHFTTALVRHMGVQPRTHGTAMTQIYQDIAASVQKALEIAMAHMVARLSDEYDIRDFCFAGGVALNCTANADLIRRFGIRSHIHPAAGDSGGALGAAMEVMMREKTQQPMQRYAFNPYIGTQPSAALIEFTLQENNITYTKSDNIADVLAAKLEQGDVISIVHGREEWGPRALGARSILADPRRAEMKEHLNAKIKFREEFRPFAPIIMAEHYDDYFETLGMEQSPYMLYTHKVKKPGTIPAVTHMDNTARVQTVSRAQNAYIYDILAAFKRRTGCPVLINTSFNLKGEPIVSSPYDALKTFANSGIDCLAIENFVIVKQT